MTKSQWSSEHGAAVTALSQQLTFARTELNKGNQPDIIASCNLLHDDLTAAMKAVPAPNPTVDAALRKAFGAISVGDSDCLEGARLASVASITERAMAELTTARTDMDSANSAIAAWH